MKCDTLNKTIRYQDIMAFGLHRRPLLYREAAFVAVTRLAVTFCRTDVQGEMKESCSFGICDPCFTLCGILVINTSQ